MNTGKEEREREKGKRKKGWREMMKDKREKKGGREDESEEKVMGTRKG